MEETLLPSSLAIFLKLVLEARSRAILSLSSGLIFGLLTISEHYTVRIRFRTYDCLDNFPQPNSAHRQILKRFFHSNKPSSVCLFRQSNAGEKCLGAIL